MLFIDKIFTSLTQSFFGIEVLIWNTIESAERLKFKAMSFTLALISIITFFGMYEFFILLVNNSFISLVSGLLITIIVINIIRFSVFTMQNPIYHISMNEEPFSEVPHKLTNTTLEVNINPQKQQQILINIKNSALKFISFFSIEVVVRTIINGILLLFIVFPFSCILSNDKISRLNENKRIELIGNYKNQEEIKFKSKCEKLNLKLHALEQKVILHPNAMYALELSDELTNNKKLITNWEIEKNDNIANFENKISNKNFIILSYFKVSRDINFILTLVFLGLLLFLCHYQKYNLVNNSSNKYYTLVNKYYYDIALQNYKSVELLIKKELSNKYSKKVGFDLLIDNYGKLVSNSPYLNPPFNSIKKEYKAPVKQMTKAEFINHYV